MALRHYWSEGPNLSGAVSGGASTGLTQSGFVQQGSAQNIGDVLLRSIIDTKIVCNVNVPTASATPPPPAWWLDTRFLVGVWCDAGRAPTPVVPPTPGVNVDPNPTWVQLVQLVPELQVGAPAGVGASADYQVLWKIPDGEIDSKAIRSGVGAATLSQVWVTWNCLFVGDGVPWNTTDAAGNSYRFGGSGYGRNLWGTNR